MDATLVKDVMTSDPVTINPEASVLEVVKILALKHFNGLPVVDKNGDLVGLVTEYNLITAEAILNIPALEKLSKTPDISTNDIQYLADHMKKAAQLRVADVMEKKPITIRYDATFEQALELMNMHHRVNPIPVVDEGGKLVGVVSRYDMLKLLKLYGHT